MNDPCPPRIGWKACENQFFLDGCRILEQTALRYWREGGAIFMPFAVQRIKEILAEQKQEAAWLRRKHKRDNEAFKRLLPRRDM